MTDSAPVNKLKMLIDIDCLYDTFFTCVRDQSEPLAVKLADDGRYFARDHDVLTDFVPGINLDQLHYRFQHRDNVILQNSLGTELVPYLETLFRVSNSQPKDHPEYREFSIVINEYPYTLSDDEKREIMNTLHELWMIEDITVIRHSHKFVSPSFLKQQAFNHYITRDIDLWVHTNAESHKGFAAPLSKTPIPEITITAPLRFTAESRNTGIKELVETSFKELFSNYVDIEFLDLHYFSFIRREKTHESN